MRERGTRYRLLFFFSTAITKRKAAEMIREADVELGGTVRRTSRDSERSLPEMMAAKVY